MSLRIAAGVLLVGLLSMGCAHGVEIRSEPPGAEVLVEGEPVGVTPMVLETTTGEVDATTVEVRQGDVSARFAIQQSEWAVMPIVAGVGLGIVGLAGGTALAVGGIAFMPFLAATLGLSSLGLTLGIAFAGYGLGLVAAAFSSWAPFVVAGLYGRKGPDVVFVDFTAGEVRSDPPGQIEPLVGLPPGQRPLRWRDEEE